MSSPWTRGARVGDLLLEERIGAGGMGEVFAAKHLGTGGRYAVKTLLRGAGEEERVRFRREAEALGSAGGHANVVRVHSCEFSDGRPYLVTELLSGGSLEERLRSGPLPEREAAELVAAIARGLAHAHALGILHRDLKPGNVLFDEHGVPKVVDFGLARLSGREALTQTGEVLGTPAYMAPEQAYGERGLDARVDVYGLGAVLYACLSGRAPFGPEPSTLALLAAVAEDAPAPLSDVEPSLAKVCLRSLAKSPEERWPSADALADALDAWRAGTRAPSGLRRGAGVALAVAAAVAAFGLAAVAIGGTRGPASAAVATPQDSLAAPTPSPAQEARPSHVSPTSDGLAWLDSDPRWKSAARLSAPREPFAKLETIAFPIQELVEASESQAIARLDSGVFVLDLVNRVTPYFWVPRREDVPGREIVPPLVRFQRARMKLQGGGAQAAFFGEDVFALKDNTDQLERHAVRIEGTLRLSRPAHEPKTWVRGFALDPVAEQLIVVRGPRPTLGRRSFSPSDVQVYPIPGDTRPVSLVPKVAGRLLDVLAHSGWIVVRTKEGVFAWKGTTQVPLDPGDLSGRDLAALALGPEGRLWSATFTGRVTRLTLGSSEPPQHLRTPDAKPSKRVVLRVHPALPLGLLLRDGRLSFVAGDDALRVGRGLPPHDFAPEPGVVDFSFSPDGDLLLLRRPETLELWDLRRLLGGAWVPVLPLGSLESVPGLKLNAEHLVARWAELSLDELRALSNMGHVLLKRGRRRSAAAVYLRVVLRRRAEAQTSLKRLVRIEAVLHLRSRYLLGALRTVCYREIGSAPANDPATTSVVDALKTLRLAAGVGR